MNACTPIHTLTHTLTHSFVNEQQQSDAPVHEHAHKHTHPHTHSHSHTHTHTHTHTNSKGLADNTVIAKVNGELWDLDRPFEGDASLKLLNFDNDEGKWLIVITSLLTF